MGAGVGRHHDVRRALRKLHLALGRVGAAEAAVQPAEDRTDAGEEPATLGVHGVALTHDDGPLAGAFVVDAADAAFGGQGALGGQGPVEDQLLLAVQHAGQVDIGLDADQGQDVEDRGDGKTGDDLQVLLVAVLQILLAGAHPQGVEHHILPGVGFGEGSELFSHRIKVEGHISSL